MSPTRKTLLTASATLLTGLALIVVLPQWSCNRSVSQQQGRAGASHANPQASPQSLRDSPGSQRTAPAAAAPDKQNRSNPVAAKHGAILDEKLTEVEQKSLWQALSEARREVREIPESWRSRKENLGYDFYALHPKQQLTSRFGTGEVQLVSSERTYTEADAGHRSNGLYRPGPQVRSGRCRRSQRRRTRE